MTNPFHRSLSWYFSKKSLPYWSILTIDSIIVLVSLLCGFWLACGGSAFPNGCSAQGRLAQPVLLHVGIPAILHLLGSYPVLVVQRSRKSSDGLLRRFRFVFVITVFHL